MPPPVTEQRPEPPAEVAEPATIRERIKKRLHPEPTPVTDAGSLIATLAPKLITWGLAAGGITLPSWAAFLLGRGATRMIRRWWNKRKPPTDPPAATSGTGPGEPVPPAATYTAPSPAKPADPTHGQPVSTGPTTINFETTYALSDTYARELAEKRAHGGASIPQEALLAQLYKEAIGLIKNGQLKTLGASNVIETIETWIHKEFMRRHGVKL